MDKDSKLLGKVIVFLVVLVSIILVFSQYELYKLLQGSYLAYASIVLIFALAGLVVWMFMEKNPEEAHHQEHIAHHEHDKSEAHRHMPWTFMEKLNYGFVAVIAVLILFNQVQISQASALIGFNSGGLSGLSFKSASAKTSLALTGDPTKDALSLIPHGTRFYSQGLGVSFDDPIKSLNIIAQLDPSYGRNKIQLSPEERARYIKIGTIPTMGCEFCCGANTAVTKDGRPTCGCQHSLAVRGLLAYLVKNYPQLSDDEIMHSLAEWKVMFFPRDMIKRYIQETQTGQYTPDIKALLLDSSQKTTQEKAPVASSGNTQTQSSSDIAATLNNLPSQVGGC